MKSLNTLIIKYFYLIIFIYIVKNLIFVKKLKNIIKNVLDIIFVMNNIFKKRLQYINKMHYT